MVASLRNLRQELDSMIRVIYLLSIPELKRRNELIAASVNGEKWKVVGSSKRITDFEMVELANKLHGWTRSVYKFGCAFIHLSNLHDYQDRDPMMLITSDERDAIAEHVMNYHFIHLEPHSKLDELLPILPAVFDKVSGNLICYLEDLEIESIKPITHI